jgi:FKBP-type peptidyl-prolyl cis-trans isomerase
VLVPSRKAFGRNGSGQIPGNASLDYTVKVLERSKLAEYEDAVIQNYLSKNSLSGFTKSADNIWYKISEPGTGSKIIGLDSTITFNYTGRLLNGTVFETNEGVSTLLSGYIPSWHKSIPLVKEGGSIRFVAPSSFSYGLAGSPASSVGQISIPAFAPLDFDVKVTKVGR